jgi:hypothetical protein
MRLRHEQVIQTALEMAFQGHSDRLVESDLNHAKNSCGIPGSDTGEVENQEETWAMAASQKRKDTNVGIDPINLACPKPPWKYSDCQRECGVIIDLTII